MYNALVLTDSVTNAIISAEDVTDLILINWCRETMIYKVPSPALIYSKEL